MNSFSNIQSYNLYNDRMSKAIMDKLFFVDKVNANLIVDFGCADGLIIKNLQNWYEPSTNFIGFDNDEYMCQVAKKNFSDQKNVTITNNWEEISKKVAEVRYRVGEDGAKVGHKTALNLSSVIHEIYHYSETKEIDAFWHKVFKTGFDYIIVRDMIPSRSIDRISDINDVAKVYRKFLDKKELRDFENLWGSVESNKNLVHFLLKYQYTTPNWDREVKENYIPLYRENLLAMLPNEYTISYHEHFVLPWLKRAVKKDFNIELKDNTHFKMILERI